MGGYKSLSTADKVVRKIVQCIKVNDLIQTRIYFNPRLIEPYVQCVLDNFIQNVQFILKFALKRFLKYLQIV